MKKSSFQPFWVQKASPRICRVIDERLKAAGFGWKDLGGPVNEARLTWSIKEDPGGPRQSRVQKAWVGEGHTGENQCAYEVQPRSMAHLSMAAANSFEEALSIELPSSHDSMYFLKGEVREIRESFRDKGRVHVALWRVLGDP